MYNVYDASTHGANFFKFSNIKDFIEAQESATAELVSVTLHYLPSLLN